MDRPGPTHGSGLTSPGELVPGPAGALVRDLLARCSFPPAEAPVVCAVSGGADSLALMVLAVSAGCQVTAVHVDHGLRQGSADEAQVVAAAAARFGAGFRSETVEVGPGPNLEARARAARYAVLPTDVLTGHTADDQAETVLLHLLRGAGLTGLSALTADRRRPIVGLRRSETVQLCDLLGLDPVIDPSNQDPAFRRNRVRHELLPLASDVAARDLVPLLTRQAHLLAEVDDLLSELAGDIDPTSAKALCTAPPALARVAIRSWLSGAGVGDGYAVDAAAVERVLAVACGDAVGTEVAGGWRVSRSAGRLALTPPSDARDGTASRRCKDARHG